MASSLAIIKTFQLSVCKTCTYTTEKEWQQKQKIMTFPFERRMAVQCNFSLGKWTCEKREGKHGKEDVKDSVLSGFVLLMQEGSERLGFYTK